mgnify:CR=1 FL=1
MGNYARFKYCSENLYCDKSFTLAAKRYIFAFYRYISCSYTEYFKILGIDVDFVDWGIVAQKDDTFVNK